MKNFKRHIALFLFFACFLSAFVFNIPEKVEAAEVKTYVGDMTLSRGSIGWNSGEYENQLMLVKPGSSLTGLYFGKVYAVYDSTAGGYVVTEKSGLHCSYSKTVASNAVGIAISYQPLTTTGSDFARTNWFVWQQIRIGDILTFTDVDVTNGTVNVSGTFGASDFVSTSKVHVTTVRDDAAETTGYTGKTIVSLGDSVTAGGAWTEAVEANINSRVINASTPGARTDEGLGYFDSQVAVHNPDIVFIKYAINDCIQYTITDSTLPNYTQNLRDLCQMALDIGALPILLTTNNIKISSLDYDRYANYGGLASYYPLYLQAIRDVAAEYNTYCIDIYNGVWSGLTATDYLIDTVHPNTAGYNLEAEYITNFLLQNEEGIISAANSVSGKVEGMPEAATNYAASANGGSYMYPTTTYPGGTTYYSTAYYGDNSNQGGAYFSGKLNDGVIPADSIPNSSNTDWAVYFSGASTPKIYIKLSERIYINNISVYHRNGTSGGVNYVAPVISSVELSNDGTTYTATTAYTSKDIASGGLNYRTKLTFSQAVNASYVCITLATPTDRTALGEIQVWGDTKLYGEEDIPFELIDGSEYTLDESYVTIFETEVTASAVAAQFRCAVTVLDSKGNTITDTAVVGTGCVVIKSDSAGNIVSSATVVVSGDIDGDSCVTTTDYMSLKAKVINNEAIEDCYGMAADYANDGSITTTDMLLMRNMLLNS